MTLLALAERVRRHMPCELIGSPDTSIDAVCHPRSLRGQASLVPLFDPALADLVPQLVASRRVAALLLTDASLVPPGGRIGALVVERPRVALGAVLSYFERPHRPDVGVDPTARVHASAVVDNTARIGAFGVVGPDCVVGPRTVLHPHVTLGAAVHVGADCVLHSGVRVGDRCGLGARVVLQPNAVIGADGFGFDTPRPSSLEGGEVQPWLKVPSLGRVVLEDDVEVGAGACVDRANLGETRIGRGSKLDNLVQVAHNVQIGEHCLFAGQVGIAGSARVGDGAVFAGQSGAKDHTSVGAGAVVMAQSGVFRDVPDGQVVFGTPARERSKALRSQAATARAAELRDTVRRLEARVADLERAADDE